MRFLIIFAFLISNCVAAEITDIKNLVINKELKKYDGLTVKELPRFSINE